MNFRISTMHAVFRYAYKLAPISEILQSGGVSGSRAVTDKRVKVKQESRLVNFASFISLFMFRKNRFTH